MEKNKGSVGKQPFLRITKAIEAARYEGGIPVAELAHRIGVDKKRLWYVFNGQREMRVDEFLKLCAALRIDPCSFVTREMVEQIADASKPKA